MYGLLNLTFAFAIGLSFGDPAVKAESPAVDPPAVPAGDPARTVDPKAKAIIERGMAEARTLRSLEVVSRMTLEGPDAAEKAPDLDTVARWTFDFTDASGDGNAPFSRVAIETLADGTVTRRVTFDGTRARSLDEKARTFTHGTLRDVGDPSVVMPGWFLDNRMGISPVGFGPDDMALPDLVAASIVGEETLDGTPCDVLESVRARRMPAPPGTDGAAGEARELRIRETVAYARTDGLARRARLVIEIEGVPPDGMASVATFTGVKANPPVGDATFDTGEPAGYAKAEPPKRMERDGPGLKVKAGDAAPAFALKDADGREVTLASLAGRVVLLDFWATWCGPCKAAMPAIQKIHDDYRDRPVSVLGVNVAERKPDAGKSYFADKGYTYGCLLAGEELSNAYGISGIPTLVVIGKDGRVELIEVGLGPDGDRELRAAIDAALAR